jgi:hypothetical protein
VCNLNATTSIFSWVFLSQLTRPATSWSRPKLKAHHLPPAKSEATSWPGALITHQCYWLVGPAVLPSHWQVETFVTWGQGSESEVNIGGAGGGLVAWCGGPVLRACGHRGVGYKIRRPLPHLVSYFLPVPSAFVSPPARRELSPEPVSGELRRAISEAEREEARGDTGNAGQRAEAGRPRCSCCLPPLGLGRCCSFLQFSHPLALAAWGGRAHIGLRVLDLGAVIPPSSTSGRGGRGSWEQLLRPSLQLSVSGSEEVEVAAAANLVRTCLLSATLCLLLLGDDWIVGDLV